MEIVHNIIRDHLDIVDEMLEYGIKDIVLLAEAIVKTIDNDGKILIFGNGGSAADAQHFAAELVNRFLSNRKALPALALTTDSSVITSISNDFDYNSIFKRQIEALGQWGDLAVGITTSGASLNVIHALMEARRRNIKTAALTGKRLDNLAGKVDILIPVHAKSTPRIQEMHILIIHIICQLVESKYV